MRTSDPSQSRGRRIRGPERCSPGGALRETTSSGLMGCKRHLCLRRDKAEIWGEDGGKPVGKGGGPRASGNKWRTILRASGSGHVEEES